MWDVMFFEPRLRAGAYIECLAVLDCSFGSGSMDEDGISLLVLLPYPLNHVVVWCGIVVFSPPFVVRFGECVVEVNGDPLWHDGLYWSELPIEFYPVITGAELADEKVYRSIVL